MPDNFVQIKKLVCKDDRNLKTNPHSRLKVNKADYQTILIKNAPYIFTCDENDKLKVRENYSIVIENGIIKKAAPAQEIQADEKSFDLIYDAGKRGGIVITPGLINTHAHPPMYLLRSSMSLDEGEDLNETLKNLYLWEKEMTPEDFAVSTIGDLTEEQKNGITTTLSHYNYFQPVDFAAETTGQNLINAISVASHVSPDNQPELIEKLASVAASSASRLAMSVHYLYRAKPEVLKKVKKLIEKHDLLFTCHFAETPKAVKETLKIHKLRETEVLKKYGLLNSNTLISHAVHLNDKDILTLAKARVGVVHLPTSNTIHKSGTFPFWKFHDAGGYPRVALGTDSVVSKSRLDLLSEAFQTRMTHIFDRTVKFGSLFKMMTINGARVLKYPDRGKILPGFKADLAFWKLKDRCSTPYDEKKPITILGNIITHHGGAVRDLMINGRFVVKERRHVLVDESKLLELLQEKHMEMRRRMK
ncbi:MAG: amidohydrolase family protein [Patescibacteria group bacterium]|jgi:5-methylthioadenosine/S-adenosylhomocysteine deaminase